MKKKVFEDMTLQEKREYVQKQSRQAKIWSLAALGISMVALVIRILAVVR